jgi:ADYC domain-containing protein
MLECQAAPFARRIGLATALAIAAPATAPAQMALSAVGTEFVLTTSAGRTLRSVDLVGAKLNLAVDGTRVELTIRSVVEDGQSVGGRVLLHHFVVSNEAGGHVDLCAPDANGRSLGFPVPDGHGGFDLTCTSGAIGKCIRWGYRPWEEQPGRPQLAALHQACIHMARADYGGDGRATTRDGVRIDLYDDFGIETPGGDPSLVFEAGWTEQGAVCVNHPRIAENVTLTEIEARWPRLAGKTGSICTEAFARAHGALLFNRSAP